MARRVFDEPQAAGGLKVFIRGPSVRFDDALQAAGPPALSGVPGARAVAGSGHPARRRL